MSRRHGQKEQKELRRSSLAFVSDCSTLVSSFVGSCATAPFEPFSASSEDDAHSSGGVLGRAAVEKAEAEVQEAEPAQLGGGRSHLSTFGEEEARDGKKEEATPLLPGEGRLPDSSGGAGEESQPVALQQIVVMLRQMQQVLQSVSSQTADISQQAADISQQTAQIPQISQQTADISQQTSQIPQISQEITSQAVQVEQISLQMSALSSAE